MQEILPGVIGALAAAILGALGFGFKSWMRDRRRKAQLEDEARDLRRLAGEQQDKLQQLHERIEDLSVTVMALRRGNVGVSLKQEIEATLQVVMDSLGATESSVLVPYPGLKRESPYLVFLALHGEATTKIRMTKVGPGSTAGRVFQTGVTGFVNSRAEASDSVQIVDKKGSHVTRNMLAVALRSEGTIVGVAQFLNKREASSFTEEDEQRAKLGLPQIAENVAQFLRSRANFEALGFYPDLAPEEGTILWSDLSSSSLMFDILSPQDAFDQISEYLQRQTQVIIDHGGAFNRYDFDGGFYSFNVPVPVKGKDHVESAVEAALDLQRDFINLKDSWIRYSRQDFEPIFSRIAITCGEVYKREMGHPRHEQLMILGEVIGRAAHLCATAPRDRHLIVMDDVVHRRIGSGRYRPRAVSLAAKDGSGNHLPAYELALDDEGPRA